MSDTALLSALRRSRFRCFFSTFVICCGLWSGSASAQISVDLSYRRYPVTIEVDQTLSQALSSSTPIRARWWRRFHGLAAWNIDWTYRQEVLGSGRCQAVGVQVRLATEITLPELIEGSENDRMAFDSYLEALKIHELGHHEIAREAAQKVHAGILDIGPHDDCVSLDARILKLTGTLIEQAKTVEKQYDDDTRYGRTQGVKLE